MQPAQLQQPQVMPWAGFNDGQDTIHFLKEPILVQGSNLKFNNPKVILVILKPVSVMGNIDITAKKIVILADLTSTHNGISLNAEQSPIIMGARLYGAKGVTSNHCPVQSPQNPAQNDINSGLSTKNFMGVWKLVAEVTRQLIERAQPQRGIVFPQM